MIFHYITIVQKISSSLNKSLNEIIVCKLDHFLDSKYADTIDTVLRNKVTVIVVAST